MELRVLGCSGGIGEQLRTTSLLLNSEVLIDAGTGLGDLTLQEMSCIRHIFLTHSHLDHVAGLPLLIDSIFDRIKTPIVIHAQPATLKAIQDHIFNNVIWPDFAVLPSPDRPVLRYETLNPGESCQLGELNLHMVTVNHVVPAVGYIMKTANHTVAFTGDTTTNDTFWPALNALDKLDTLIVEAAFTNSDLKLSQQAGHYCPSSLAADLTKLNHQAKVYLSHHKPGAEAKILTECQQEITTHKVDSLHGGQIIPL